MQRPFRNATVSGIRRGRPSQESSHQADEARLVQVLSARVAGRGETVGVVVRVPLDVARDLEEVLVQFVAAIGDRRRWRASRQRRRRPRGRRGGTRPSPPRMRPGIEGTAGSDARERPFSAPIVAHRRGAAGPPRVRPRTSFLVAVSAESAILNGQGAPAAAAADDGAKGAAGEEGDDEDRRARAGRGRRQGPARHPAPRPREPRPAGALRRGGRKPAARCREPFDVVLVDLVLPGEQHRPPALDQEDVPSWRSSSSRGTRRSRRRSGDRVRGVRLHRRSRSTSGRPPRPVYARREEQAPGRERTAHRRSSRSRREGARGVRPAGSRRRCAGGRPIWGPRAETREEGPAARHHQ